jgi:hypothetical protein
LRNPFHGLYRRLMVGVDAANLSFLRRCSNYFGNLRRSGPSKFPEKLAVMTHN